MPPRRGERPLAAYIQELLGRYGPEKLAPFSSSEDDSIYEPGERALHEPFINVKDLKEDREIDDYYRRLEILGQGAFATTYEVVKVDPHGQGQVQDNIRLAMKVQPKLSQWAWGTFMANTELFRLYKEIVIQNRILPSHPNILRIKDVVISPTHVYMVTELCGRKSLNDFYPVADNDSARKVFKQLAEAIRFVHEYGVVHFDLKSDNVLFADLLDPFEEIKVIDFGVSVYRPEWARKAYHDFNYKKWFHRSDLTGPANALHLHDVQSLGKILHEIMAGKPVQYRYLNNYQREMRNTYRPRLKVFDEAAMNLLEQIGPSPFGPERDEDFLTIDQICQHPWLVKGNLIWTFRNFDEEFASLQTDLTVLKDILKNWVIMPMRVISGLFDFAEYYDIIGSSQRGAFNTGQLECISVDTSKKHSMKILYRIGDPSMPETQAEGQPLRIYNELLITMRILPRHEHFVEIDDVFVNTDFVIVVRELYPWHTLEAFFPTAINENARKIFRQIAETVRVMHKYGVVHMDLQCDSIVFKDKQYTDWKIVDFSKALYSKELRSDQITHEQFQAERWITPELSLMSSNASADVDVRALGVILLAMICGKWVPTPDSVDWFIEPEREALFDDDAKDLLSKIGPPPYGPRLDHTVRTLTMDQICDHPWLASQGIYPNMYSPGEELKPAVLENPNVLEPSMQQESTN